ncbi:MAG TPA: hypothetical protein VKU03_06495 [Roseiarcus sp.]|nr:hypothetical protein [Roseiarcus sp.]
MAGEFTDAQAARFLRTLRVATQTALAEYALSGGRAASRPRLAFMALAAKGPGEWRFPASGLLSADGLVLAKLVSEPAAEPVLELQAQGVAGLSLYASRSARATFAGGRALDGAFDRDGRMRLSLAGAAIEEADLSSFELELLDEAP